MLVHRQLRPGIDPASISRFGDNRWHLSPAVHEDHYRSFSLNFELVPAAFRRIAKVYVWMELNHDHDWVSVRRSGVTGRGAVYTLHYRMPHLRSLLYWLTEQEISSLADVTHQDLDRYLEAVRDSESNLSKQAALLNAVRRLWVLRDLLPPDGRLPEAPPWKGKDNRILGRTRYDLENRTRRIPEPTMSALCWSLRFVEDFSDDILAALGEYRPLVGVTQRRTSLTEAAGSSSAKAKAAWLADRVDALLDDHRHRGEPLPGRALPDGTTEPDWMHIARLIGCSHLIFTRRRSGYHRDRILASGVPVADAVYLRCRPRRVLDERLWLDRIRYDQVPQLVRALHTACFVVLAYLSGARPGEVLTLERGCVSRHPRTGLWQLTGRKWKGATDFNGVKIPEGQLREDPWIVIEPVARAVSVLEQLHNSPKLFPVSILMARSSDRDGTKSTNTIAEDLHLFVEWVNTYCRSRDRGDGVPVSAERLSASRFRRTLAWFICRRPRGLVAAAIQYGHLHVQITQGYSGSYASGFPDDIAFERWLARLDELDEADRRLNEGGHVSGPAADAYRSRVAGGASRFAGRVIRSGKAARHVLANPSLQIYPGRGMTCVFNAATALCELVPSTDDARHTPDTDDCRPNCRNIARTDADIDDIRAEAADLRAVVDDPASPPLRLARERQRLDRLQATIAEHERGRNGNEDRS